VNLLPEWARGTFDEVDLEGESDSVRRAYGHHRAAEITRAATTESVLNAMDVAGVTKALCFSHQWLDQERCRSANDYVAKALAENPTRMLGLAVVQPRSPDAATELSKRMDTPGFVGLKTKPKWGGFGLSETALLGPLCEVLESRNGFLLTHVSQNFHRSSGDNLGDLLALLRDFPNLTVVAAHLAGFVGVYECYEPVRRNLENLFIDISLPDNLEWLPHLMRNGDATRYIYGTDFPYIDFADFDRRLGSVGLTDREMEMLCVENPRRLLFRTT
jgi:predicted TIM-barrel fold metal-dependent hydrolase